MLPEDVQLISVDDHVIEHERVWLDRLEAKYLDAGPRIVELEGGSQAWSFEGKVIPTIGLNAVAGKDPKDFGIDPVRFDEMLPGCYDVAARLADMDLDGVHAQMCFPSFPGFCGSTLLAADDKELATACVVAWNDFILDEWSAAAPHRFIPMVMVPFWDVEASVAEVERTAAKGAKAITFTEAPHRLDLPSYHSDHWDPFLAAAQDADMPLCLHFGTGGAPVTAADAPFAVAIALFGMNSQFTTVDLLLSPVFHKFPRLRVALSEGGIGWIPYAGCGLIYTWERHRWYTGVNTDVRPSDLFSDHIFGCFIADDAGIEERKLIGVDNIMFEGDYPHSDSNFPASRKKLADVLLDVPDGEARRIAEDNARRVFNFPRCDVKGVMGGELRTSRLAWINFVCVTRVGVTRQERRSEAMTWNYELFIDGKWTSEAAEGLIEVVDPATEEVIGTVPEATKKTAVSAIEAARRAFDEGPWPWMKPSERGASLIRMAEILESRAADLRELIVAETGSTGFMTDAVQGAGSIGMFRSNASIVEHSFPWVENEMLPRGGPTGLVRTVPPSSAEPPSAWSAPSRRSTSPSCSTW